MARVARSSTFAIAVILAILGIWIARTFSSTPIVLPLGLGWLIVVVLRVRWIQRHRPDRNEPDSFSVDVPVALPSSRRWHHAVLTILMGSFLATAVAIERLSVFSGENINYLFLATDLIAHVSWCVAALLLIVYPLTGHVAMMPLGSILALVTIAGGGVSQSITGQVTSALGFCIVFITASQILGLAKSWSGRHRGELKVLGVASAPTSGVRWLLSLAVLSLILTVTSTLATATNDALPDIQTTLQSGLRDTLEAVRVQSPIGSGQYVNGSRFGSVRRDLLRDPQAVALRVFAASEPGYLRGNVFDLYSDRRWLSIDTFEAYRRTRYTTERHDRIVKPSGPATALKQGMSSRPSRHFDLLAPTSTIVDSSLSLNPLRLETLEVRNDPLRGAIIFMPLTANWIEASSRQLSVSDHNTILSGGIDLTEPYVVGVTERVPPHPLSSEMREVLLSVPGNLASTTAQIVATELDDSMTPRLKASRVSGFFQRNFTYSLEYQADTSGGELIGNFLRTRHPAHCEYFATATAMLLRQAGVPTRYVTGYVADEFSPDSNNWLARNADAHAWVEAYDDLSREWFPVESTPGRSYHTLTFPRASGDGASGTTESEQMNESSGRSFFDQLSGWIALLSSNDPVLAALRMLQIPLLVVVGGLLWLRRRSHKREVIDPIDRQSHRRLAQVDRRVRRLGLIRQDHETLHQFADRIESSELNSQGSFPSSLIATWYRQYASARYQGQLPAALDARTRSQTAA